MDAEPKTDPIRLAGAAERIAELLQRLTDELATAAADHAVAVDVATKLGRTTAWITGLIKKVRITGSCVVPGQATARCGSSTAAASTSGSNAAEHAASAVRAGACRSSKG